MYYWVIALLSILALVVIYSFFKSRILKKKKLAEIREQWGKPKYLSRNFKLIAAYLTNDEGGHINESTAADLDLDDVFCYIDRTNSKPGQQYLYKKLHSPQVSESYFESLEQSINHINSDKNLREQTELKLSELGGTDAYYLPQLFSNIHQSIFSPLTMAYIVTGPVLTILLIVKLFVAADQFTLFFLLAVLIANVFIHYSNKTKMLSFTNSLPQLLILNRVGKWLLSHNLLKKNDATHKSLANVDKLKKSLGFISLQNKTAVDPTDMTYLLSEWFKMFLLIEPLVFIISISRVNKYLNDIKVLYEAVAQVDMAISIQSVRDGAAGYCKPNFSAGDNHIVIKDLYHPLIENCVANSISIDNKHGILVTGSNMSGKTTFIRAIALNALLSQTINTSFSSAYSAPPLKIFTSINITDDLGDSKSYFQAEALAVKSIVIEALAAKPVNSLVIIDEIFRGTNTIERIAAAKAVLSHFIENNSFVFVSTHDLELAELLGSAYKVFSFEELIGDQRLVFDYKLKEGLLKNRNGIAVLQGLGFPDSIINEANKVSIQLRDKYDL
ncbi:MutS-related protein [Mucilaginibacter sp. FT3.2]|uniref:MutS-related protein n=1 Tax=Mucilaginibacter sp. FT3.2 TaxID=2723090 RepID=UPI00161946D5|nr:hypothetical protein [Mucilaginibacter sp. FT3.2]MBB6235075.1 hypothetical protein [Mucilaginibacter sp. FT3.2]